MRWMLLVVVTACAAGQTGGGERRGLREVAGPGLEAIRTEALRAHVLFLADDAREGRAPGSKGHREAAQYVAHNIRCNCIAPGRVHTPFVDGFLATSYPGREAEMFAVLSRTQPIGRMGKPSEIAALALYLCSDEASFVTGCDYPIDGGFVKLNT